MTDTAANNPTTQLQQLLAAGFEHHRAGRGADAEAIYRQVLATYPEQPDALSLLGILALQSGRVDLAIELLGRCAQISPDNFAAHNNVGEALRNAGRMDDALASFRRAIALNPNHPDAYCNLAVAMERLGRNDDAITALARACELLPDRADLFDRTGALQLRAGDVNAAVASFRRAIGAQPNFAQAYGNLAVALTNKPFEPTLADEALAIGKRAVELSPQAAEAHACLGAVFTWMKRPDEAIAEYESAAKLQPTVPDHYGRRASLLCELDRNVDAINVLTDAIAHCRPDARLHSLRSAVHRRERDLDRAVSDGQIAVKLAPNFSEGHGNLSLGLLAQGDYVRGFAEYEWRWRCDSFTTASRDYDAPMWNGTSDLTGRTILIHTEQGYGDTLQFARFIPKLAAAGATVIFDVHHSLFKLMQRLPGVSRLISTGIAPPRFDLHAPLLSLPGAFKTTLESIPRQTPYLFAAPERVAWWNEKLSEAGRALKVGIVWAGNAEPDRRRTIPGQMLEGFGDVPGVQFFSLQRPDAGTYSPPPAQLQLIDLAPQLGEFHETAAAMSALDLVLTIDTAAAHLAGALGRPTWTMLPWSCDWRWMPERPESIWYPTMRLFRQPQPNGWRPVIDEVRAALRERISS